VGLTDRFLLAEFCHPAEDIVGVGDPALEVGLADDDFLLAERLFAIGRRDR
jgi:hypothetical protein